MAKVGISLSDALYQKVEAQAKAEKLTVSGFISKALEAYFSAASSGSSGGTGAGSNLPPSDSSGSDASGSSGGEASGSGSPGDGSSGGESLSDLFKTVENVSEGVADCESRLQGIESWFATLCFWLKDVSQALSVLGVSDLCGDYPTPPLTSSGSLRGSQGKKRVKRNKGELRAKTIRKTKSAKPFKATWSGFKKSF